MNSAFSVILAELKENAAYKKEFEEVLEDVISFLKSHTKYFVLLTDNIYAINGSRNQLMNLYLNSLFRFAKKTNTLDTLVSEIEACLHEFKRKSGV